MDRKEWIDELNHRVMNAIGEYEDYVDLTVDDAKEIIKLLEEEPQKHGHWDILWTCSVCNERLRISLDGRTPIFDGIRCCPNCGAKMKEVVFRDGRQRDGN